jgi:hypothetical protein
MAYTKYSLTPANNNATPPDGAPEGMLPSAVNDTMRDMMAQIRDVGDGIRGGTYTMTAPVITGGTITGVAFTGNTFTSPVISGGSINNTPIGASTANTGAFTTLSATGNVSFDGGSFVFNEAGADKDARFEGDTDANLLFLDASTDRIGIGTSSPGAKLDVRSGSTVFGFQLSTTGTNSYTATASTSLTNANLQIFGTNGSSGDATGIRLSQGGSFELFLGGVEEAGGAGAFVFQGYSGSAYAERMRIDSSGNVGIGTSSPGQVLEVSKSQDTETQVRVVNANTGSSARSGFVLGNNSNAGAASLLLNSSNNTGLGGANALNMYQGLSAPIAFFTNATERMRITSGGNVGINTTTFSTGYLTIDTKAQAGIDIYRSDSSAQYNGIRFRNTTNGSTYGSLGWDSSGLRLDGDAGTMYFSTSGTERMRINASGEFLYNCTGRTNDAPNVAGGRINETNGNEKVRVAADTQVAFQFYSPSGGTASPVGTITANASSVSYNTSSDYRLKENIAPMTGALATVTQLKPVTYTWKNTGETGQGFIAHELQEVVPDCVTGEKDAVDKEGKPIYQGVDTSFLVATLTSAIQELHEIVKAQAAEIALLKSK